MGFGFFCSIADSSLFIYRNDAGTIFLLLYADDIIITSSLPTMLHAFIAKLNKEFATKDLGPLHYFLGISIFLFSGGLFLHQQKYAIEILDRAQMRGCKPVFTPMVSKLRSRPCDNEPFLDPSFYRSIVGGLQYLTITRPDITFSVNYVCHFLHQPT